MNYSEIVLKLIHKRKTVTVIKDILLKEFIDKENPTMELEKWCIAHRININKTPEDKNLILTLVDKKTTL